MHYKANFNIFMMQIFHVITEMINPYIIFYLPKFYQKLTFIFYFNFIYYPNYNKNYCKNCKITLI